VIEYGHTDNYMSFKTASTERMRIDSSGNVGINTTSPSRKFSIYDTSEIPMRVETNTSDTKIEIITSSGTQFVQGSANNLLFGTNNTERIRITSGGNVLVGKSTDDDNTTGVRLAEFGALSASRVNNVALILNRTGTDGSIAYFRNDGIQVGDISISGTTTSYNTSSDYRLKENVVNLIGALDRLDDLSPRRFNFIADSNTTVDGFIAHEVQSVVPEAVSGTHNEVDDDGNAIYQGIDQAKLVPLLTAALQEAHTMIKDLKSRVETLENA